MPVLLTAAATAAAASALGCWVAIRTAARTGFIDHPGTEAHKLQKRAVPYGGGAGIAAGLAAGVVAAWLGGLAPPRWSDHGPLWPVAAGALALFLLGLWDDRRRLPAKPKLAVQIAVALATVWLADLPVDSLRPWPVLAWGASVGWIVLVTNAYNLLDHADGLSATAAGVASAALVYGAMISGDPQLAALYAALLGGLLGFLAWNRPPARIYMGDAGALPLGYLIAVGCLAVTFWPNSESRAGSVALLTPLLLTALPLFDTAVVVIKRWRRGKPLMVGDRQHIGHRLGRLGLSPLAALGVVGALQVALALGALQLRGRDLLGAGFILAQVIAILGAVVLLETTRDDHE